MKEWIKERKKEKRWQKSEEERKKVREREWEEKRKREPLIDRKITKSHAHKHNCTANPIIFIALSLIGSDHWWNNTFQPFASNASFIPFLQVYRTKYRYCNKVTNRC